MKNHIIHSRCASRMKRLCFVFLECFEMWRRLQTIENTWAVQYIHLNTQSLSTQRSSYTNGLFGKVNPSILQYLNFFFRFCLCNKRPQGLNRSSLGEKQFRREK